MTTGRPRNPAPIFKGEDCTGRQIGGWVVLKRTDDSLTRWDFQCVNCSKVLSLLASGVLYSKNVYGCMTCRNKLLVHKGPDNGFWKGTGSGKIPGSVLCKVRNSCNRARKLDMDVDLDYLEDLMCQQDWKCTYSGKALYFGSGPNNSGGNASLDRIDSSKGYLKGNVSWVDVNVNRAKWEMTPKEFVDMCKAVVEHNLL